MPNKITRFDYAAQLDRETGEITNFDFGVEVVRVVPDPDHAGKVLLFPAPEGFMPPAVALEKYGVELPGVLEGMTAAFEARIASLSADLASTQAALEAAIAEAAQRAEQDAGTIAAGVAALDAERTAHSATESERARLADQVAALEERVAEMEEKAGTPAADAA